MRAVARNSRRGIDQAAARYIHILRNRLAHPSATCDARGAIPVRAGREAQELYLMGARSQNKKSSKPEVGRTRGNTSIQQAETVQKSRFSEHLRPPKQRGNFKTFFLPPSDHCDKHERSQFCPGKSESGLNLLWEEQVLRSTDALGVPSPSGGKEAVGGGIRPAGQHAHVSLLFWCGTCHF